MTENVSREQYDELFMRYGNLQQRMEAKLESDKNTYLEELSAYSEFKQAIGDILNMAVLAIDNLEPEFAKRCLLQLRAIL
jgi:hypothetical protein